MTLESIKEAIEPLREKERVDLLRWLDEREEAAWDADISRNFSSGGRGNMRRFKRGDRVWRIPGSGRRYLAGRLGTVINDGIDYGSDMLGRGVSYAVLWDGNKAREYIAQHWLEKVKK